MARHVSINIKDAAEEIQFNANGGHSVAMLKKLVRQKMISFVDPAVVMVQAGTVDVLDIFQKNIYWISPAKVAERVLQLCFLIADKYPAASILVCSVLPIPKIPESIYFIKKLNSHLCSTSTMCIRNVSYVNTWNTFVKKDWPKEFLFNKKGIHLTKKGKTILAMRLKQHLSLYFY